MAHQFFFNPFILDNLPAPNTGFDVVQDISEPRLRMYVTSRGVKTFFVRKRVHGRDRRIIIGNYPTVDIEDARNAVHQILENAMQKPRVHRKKITLKKFLDIYLEKRVRRNSTSRYKLERAIARHLTQILDKNMSDITRDDVAGVIEKIPGPAIASRMQEFLQSVFKYAVDSGYIKSNPLVGMVKIKQNRRVRPLNRAGFHRLMNAINNENDPNLRSAFLMLVYGFAPKSRVFSMQWCDLDFNHDTWCDVPLSDMAVVLLQDLPQDSIWVFPGRGRGHLTDPRIAWRRVANAAGIPNLTMDDVHKFLMRQVVWASDREDFRNNMNALLDDVLTQ